MKSPKAKRGGLGAPTTIYMDREIKAALKAYCEKKDIPMSQFIGKAVVVALKAKGPKLGVALSARFRKERK